MNLCKRSKQKFHNTYDSDNYDRKVSVCTQHNAKTAAKMAAVMFDEMVGTARFELATSRTPSVRATRLRHVPSP